MNFKAPRLSSYQIWALIAGALLLASAIWAIALFSNPSRARIHHHQQDYYKGDYQSSPIQSDGEVDDSFTTHLPLVILDTKGDHPRADSIWSEEKGYRIPAPWDPYAVGTMDIIAHDSGVNRIGDEPSLTTKMKIRLRGNSSIGLDKHQYLIKTTDDYGDEYDTDVLGMGADSEWVLNISALDKSLLRNYVALNTAGSIMPYTPDVRYCEVLMREGTEYEYLGVFLMMENVKRGDHRVGINPYDKHDAVVSYMLRRDRYDETALLLDTYGRETSRTPGFLEVRSPNKSKLTKSHLSQITMEIDAMERALFADNAQDYYQYLKYVDQQSFVDYFIINEFFGNYDAGFNSTYFYKLKGGLLCAGPVWDFDQSMDNYSYSGANTGATAMHDAPWFRQLLRDRTFVDAVVKRYYQLRQNVLSEEALLTYFDETSSFLGEAARRDWVRWGYLYREKELSEDIVGRTRNVMTQQGEIDRMKEFVAQHGRWLDENIDSLYQFAEFGTNDMPKTYLNQLDELLYGEGKAKGVQGVLAILFLATFVISVILIQRM